MPCGPAVTAWPLMFCQHTIKMPASDYHAVNKLTRASPSVNYQASFHAPGLSFSDCQLPDWAHCFAPDILRVCVWNKWTRSTKTQKKPYSQSEPHKTICYYKTYCDYGSDCVSESIILVWFSVLL